MPLKNSNTVAVERRVDLASLFCMIGRHGPAVALAVIAMVSVLAGFIIYRTVRGKRRKATTADDDSQSPGEERDGSVVRSPEERHHSPAESTDVSDEGSSDVREDLIQSDLTIRHRRAAPSPYSPPKSEIKVPDNKHTTPDDTEEVALVWDSYKVAEQHAEEANQSLQSDTYTEAEMVLEDAVDCHQGETDNAIKDVLEEVHDNDNCWKEPEPINADYHEKEGKVFEAVYQEDEDVIMDKTTREDEENFDCALNNKMCFEQTPLMSEHSDDDRLQNETTNSAESNSEEPVIYIEDVPCACYGKDDEVEEVNPDSADYSYCGNNHLSPEGIKKNEDEEAEEECVDHQVNALQAEVWSSLSEQETNLLPAQEEQWDPVTNKVTPPVRDSDWDEDGSLAGEEAIVEDHLKELTAVRFDTPSPQFVKQDVEIEQKEENGLMCDQEDGVLGDQIEEKLLITENIVACSEECYNSNVGPSPALPCLSAPVKVDNHDDSLSGITTDTKAQISGIADVPDLSSDRQHPLEPSLDEDADSANLGFQMPSNETENQPEINMNVTTMVFSDEYNDQVHDHLVQSCVEDQQSVQTIRNEFDKAHAIVAPDVFAWDSENVTTPIIAEVFDKVCVAAIPHTVENVPSVIVKEVFCPHLPSICQDHMEDNETFDKMGFDSAADADACNNATLTALLTSEELSCPYMSSLQDQQSDQTRNKEDSSEVINGAAPVMTEDLITTMCQMHLPSFEQSELRDNDISSSGVGEESGISSMTISPDAGNEFDVIFEDKMVPAMDCDQQAKEQTGAQNSLFADDVAISVIKEDTTGTVFGHYPSGHFQPTLSAHTEWTNYESFAANEDMFGHEVEESYHRAMDKYAAQIAESVTSFADEFKKKTDVKVVVEVVEVKEKKAGVSVGKKEETKAEEKEEEYEKTEISIMEATMDHNEWIMDSAYQALPWMNLSATSFTQDQTQTNQPPTEECNSTVADTTCTDTTDIQPSIEVKQTTSTLSLVDESTDNNKKVVAVQPMPQNVNVTFRVHYFTQSPYQAVAVTGNQEELGNWKGFIPLERAKDGHWSTVVSLPTESIVEWKFVVVDKGEVCRWEECGNRLLDTGFGDDLLVHKWWGRL